MADLKVNITATDKATPTINAVGKSMANLGKATGSVQSAVAAFSSGGLPGLTQKLSGLAAGLGGVTGQLGLMIGAGGIGGLTAGVVQFLPQALALSDSFLGWATGIDAITAAYDQLDPKLKQQQERVQEILHQNALIKTAGSERARLEQTFVQQQIAALEKERAARQKALDESEKSFKVIFSRMPVVSKLYEMVTGRIEKQKTALEDVTQRLGEMELKAVGAGKLLAGETAEEGTKRVKEQQTAFEQMVKTQKDIDELGRKRLEYSLGTGVSEEAIAAGLAKQAVTAKSIVDSFNERLNIQKEINQLGLKRLEKVLGTGVTEEAIEGGLEKNAATAKQIIKDRQEQLKNEHDLFVKLNDARDAAAEKQRQQWEHMYDTIREGAGRVFDAMLTKGEGVFTSLAKFAEGMLQTMLRGVFQNAAAGLLGGGRSGGGGVFGSILGIGGSAATGALGGIFGGGGGGARLQQSIVGAGTKNAAGGGFLGKLFGLGGSGAAGAVGLGGTLAAGAATAGIATAVALGASFITGLFQGGANRRAAEQARRAGLIAENQFAAPETVTRYGIAGGAGYTVETDLTGNIRGIGKTPTVVTTVNVQMIDAKSAEAAGNIIAETVNKRIMTGGSLLADNIAWAAS